MSCPTASVCRCAVRRLLIEWRREAFASVPSQRGGEAGGSLTREVPGWVASGPTKPWRVGTARRRGCGERGGKAYARNRRLRLSKTHRLEPGGSAPEATHSSPSLRRRGTPRMSAGGWGGRGDVLRGSHGDVAGVESGASSVERSTSEHGNRPWSGRGSRSQRSRPGWALPVPGRRSSSDTHRGLTSVLELCTAFPSRFRIDTRRLGRSPSSCNWHSLGFGGRLAKTHVLLLECFL